MVRTWATKLGTWFLLKWEEECTVGDFCEASPLRSVSGRGERLQRCSHHRNGPLSPATTSWSDATQLTCDCLFSLKKCQSVRSQVCYSSSCFCCFLPPPTLSVFPCRLQRDQSDAAGRIWIFQVWREGCVSHHLCSAERQVPPLAQTQLVGPLGPGDINRGHLSEREREHSFTLLLSITLSFYSIWTKNKWI